MGQYHLIYNLDKKEMLHPHNLGDGLKLLEFSGGATAIALCVLLANSNGRGGGDLYVSASKRNENFEPIYSSKEKKQMLDIAQVSGRWAGDRIVVQGDYAEPSDSAFIPEEAIEGFTDISSLCVKALAADIYLKKQMLDGDFTGCVAKTLGVKRKQRVI